MDTLQAKRGLLHIDANRLRRYRLQKRWTQRDLAQTTGFSEDYISQLERAATTRNKGTRLETILRLAQALEVAPVDLLTEKLSEALRADMTRRELLGNTTSLGVVRFISMLNPSWYRAYYHDIDERVEQKDGAFQALQYIYINVNRMLPTQYL